MPKVILDEAVEASRRSPPARPRRYRSAMDTQLRGGSWRAQILRDLLPNLLPNGATQGNTRQHRTARRGAWDPDRTAPNSTRRTGKHGIDVSFNPAGRVRDPGGPQCRVSLLNAAILITVLIRRGYEASSCRWPPSWDPCRPLLPFGSKLPRSSTISSTARSVPRPMIGG